MKSNKNNTTFSDLTTRLQSVNPLVFIILFVLNILVSVGFLGVDEELLVCTILLIVFFTLVEVLKGEFKKSVSLSCISIWEFLNFELNATLKVYSKLKKYTLYYIILRFKYKFWGLWSKFLIHYIYISSFVTASKVYIKFLDLFILNNLYKFYYIETLLNMNIYENIYSYSKVKVEQEIISDPKMISKL